MFPLLQNADGWVLVRLEDSLGANATGIANTVPTARIAKQGAADAALDLTVSGVWVEAGKGAYWVKLRSAASQTDTVGQVVVTIDYLGKSTQYVAWVRANSEAEVFVRLGAPVGASHAADVAAVKVDTAAALVELAKLLGVTSDNTYRAQHVYDGNGNLTSARLRAYDTAANATTHGATGLLYTWTFTATFSAANVMTSMLLTRA